jgi:hypothetical protein
MKLKMNPRLSLYVLVAIAALALAGGLALRHAPLVAASPATAATLSGGHYQLTGLEAAAPLPAAPALRGGHYRLTSLTQAPGDLASGGRYHLQALDSPQLAGVGCCCMYLPCVRR